MRWRRSTWGLLALVAAVFLAASGTACGGSAITATPVVSGAASPPSIQTGIYVDRPEGATGSLLYRRIKNAGANLVRFTVSWRAVAPAKLPSQWDPTNPGDSHYRWGTYDAQIKQAVSHGLTPLVT